MVEPIEHPIVEARVTSDLAQQYFDAIQAVWSPYSDQYRMIAFCTPVCSNPSAIIIGTNHSDFVQGGGTLSERIADRLAAEPPTENTFLVHDHKFAKGSVLANRAGPPQ